MSAKNSIYSERAFWIGALERAVKTAAQSGVAALTAAIFTPVGLGAFGIVVGLAFFASVLTSLATPERVVCGVEDHPSEPDYKGWEEAELDH